jgi:competence protein ComEC
MIHYTITPSIEFIDVGQGDSILVRLNKGKDILIDTGGILKYENEFKRANEFSIGSDLLVPYLKSIGIDNIDYMFITHGDMDHIGGAEDIIKSIKVKNIYLNGSINTLEESLLKYNPNYLKEKDVIEVNNITLNILNPGKYTNENDSSLVIYFNIKGYNILLMGDASKQVEEDLINKYDLNVDILKLGHHGSKTSTSNKFIENIKPIYGIISVGESNKFGHPHKNVIDILNNNNVNVYRTDYYGSIKFIFENKLKIKTGRCYEG